MSEILRDRLLSAVLFLVGAGWALASLLTIPDGYSGSSISPRSFPLLLGLLLAALAVLALVESERHHRGEAEPAAEGEPEAETRDQIWATLATFGFLIAYFLALPILGFTLATTVSIAAFLWLGLGLHRPGLVVGMGVGLGIGLHVLMVRLLGVYLPTGIIGLGA